MTTTTTTELDDRLAILDLIGRLVLLLDGRNWDALEQVFTDTVYHDRTSLTVENLDAVHHTLTCHVISLDGDQATGAANTMGTHVLANSSGGPVWTVGGRHDYQLKRTGDGSRIAGITSTIQWATGNQNMVALAIAKGQSA